MYPAILAVLAVTAVVLIVIRKRQWRRDSVRRKKEHGVERVKISTVFRLEGRYGKEFDDYFSRQLAQAVTNELFASKPGSMAEAKFMKYNADLVREKVKHIEYDIDLRRVVTQALRVQNSRATQGGNADAAPAPDPVEHFEELGLLVPATQAPSVDAFVRIAKDFCDANGAPQKQITDCRSVRRFCLARACRLAYAPS